MKRFVTSLHFYGDELLAPRPKPKYGGPPLVGCTRLHIQHIRRYLPTAGRSSSIDIPTTCHAVETVRRSSLRQGSGEVYTTKILIKYYSSDLIKKNELGRKCDTYGGLEMCLQGFGGEQREGDHLGDPCTDGRIILKWIFTKWDDETWTTEEITVTLDNSFTFR